MSALACRNILIVMENLKILYIISSLTSKIFSLSSRIRRIEEIWFGINNEVMVVRPFRARSAFMGRPTDGETCQDVSMKRPLNGTLFGSLTYPPITDVV